VQDLIFFTLHLTPELLFLTLGGRFKFYLMPILKFCLGSSCFAYNQNKLLCTFCGT